MTSDPHDFEFSPPPFEQMAEQMQQRYRMPDWFGPPTNWLPGTAALHHVAGRSPDAVVLLSGIRAYPTGFRFDMVSRLREPSIEIDQAMFGHPVMPGMPGAPGSTGTLPAGMLRVALVFADGSSASTVGQAMMMPFEPGEDGTPPGPVLMQNGGGGGGGEYEWGYWCWPLPPEGDVSVVCEWPAAGIPRNVTTFPAGPVRDAAQQAEQLWEDPPEPPAMGPGGPVDVVIG